MTRTIMKLEIPQKNYILKNNALDFNIKKVSPNISYDELARMYYNSYHDTIDDEGENIYDWKVELESVFNGKYGPLILEMCYFLYLNDEKVGNILCSKFRGIVLILYVIVIPEKRGERLSELLLDKVISTAQFNGIKDIYLVVTDNNSAKNVYKSLGFKSVGRDWKKLSLY